MGAMEAQQLALLLGSSLQVRSMESAAGRGLFLLTAVAAGAVVCELEGNQSYITPYTICGTHCVRIPRQRSRMVDGQQLADGLVALADKTWWPERAEDELRGYGALANSSVGTGEEATTRLVCLLDDTAGSAGNLEQRRIDSLGYRLFLVAQRCLAAGEEITWHYQFICAEEVPRRTLPAHVGERNARACKRAV